MCKIATLFTIDKELNEIIITKLNGSYGAIQLKNLKL